MPSRPPAEGGLATHTHGPLRPAQCLVSTDLPQSPFLTAVYPRELNICTEGGELLGFSPPH